MLTQNRQFYLRNYVKIYPIAGRNISIFRKSFFVFRDARGTDTLVCTDTPRHHEKKKTYKSGLFSIRFAFALIISTMKQKNPKSPKLLRVNSVLSRSAESTIQSHVVFSSEVLGSTVLMKLEELKKMNLAVYVLATLQLRFACRINELLRISYKDIDQLGRIIIHGSKGSSDKVIDSGEWREQFLNFRKFNVSPFESLNYDYVYRCYRQVGLKFTDGISKKQKVTHALRYAGISLLSAPGVNMEAKQQLTGHKQAKTTKYYDKRAIY